MQQPQAAGQALVSSEEQGDATQSASKQEAMEPAQCEEASASERAQQDLETDLKTITEAFRRKRDSDRHSLAQFTEVEVAAIRATASTSEKESEVQRPSDASTARESVHPEEPVAVDEDDASCCPSTTEGCISLPYKTRQEVHVTYNVEHARYEGLPWAWRTLNHQFGLPLEAVPKMKLAQYETKIPAVLQMMKRYLLTHGGAQQEGIFRLAPDIAECQVVKQAINEGNFSSCSDVHIIANLIKVSAFSLVGRVLRHEN